MDAAGPVPKTEGGKGDQFQSGGVFGKQPETNEHTGHNPGTDASVIFGPPKGKGRPTPKEDVNGVDRHEGSADRKERNHRGDHDRPESGAIGKEPAAEQEDRDPGAAGEEHGKKPNAKNRLAEKRGARPDQPRNHRPL